MKIAVAGGTGVVGRHTVDAVRAAGHEPVVIARSLGIDVSTGAGLAAALTGVDVVIDAVNVETMKASKAEGWFANATNTLLAAEAIAKVRHHVVLSIVGIDQVDFGYYLGKRVQEKAALAGDIPVTILRATQFHEFPEQTLARAKGPIAPVPRMRSQTVAASEVAAELVRLAVGDPQGRAPDIAGPEVHEMPDLARRVLEHAGSKRRVVAFPIPGAAGKAMAGGALLPQGAHTRGRITFDAWLSSRPR